MIIILGIMFVMWFIFTICGIAWFEMKTYKETLKEPSFNPEIQEHQRFHIAKILLTNETEFHLTPSYALHHMPLYRDSDEKYVIEFYSDDHFRLKVYKVSCYSDNSGVTNYRGFIH